jgi:hypothetical protein
MVEIHEAGNLMLAKEYIEKSQRLANELPWKMAHGNSNLFMGHLALHQKEPERAVHFLRESLVYYSEIENRLGVIWCICDLGVAAGLAAGRDNDVMQGQRAAMLFGAGEIGHTRQNFWMPPYMRQERDDMLPKLRELLGEEEFERCWSEGYALSYEDAMREALNDAARV